MQSTNHNNTTTAAAAAQNNGSGEGSFEIEADALAAAWPYLRCTRRRVIEQTQDVSDLGAVSLRFSRAGRACQTLCLAKFTFCILPSFSFQRCLLVVLAIQLN
jgi:hypothetical protein